MKRARSWLALAAAAAVAGLVAAPTAQAAPCDAPVTNPVACENTKTGNPQSEWDVNGAGDAGIQGFATDISVAQGATVHFKVDTNASDYRLDIYRLGYYGGAGARLVATVQPSVNLPQNQPDCGADPATGLIDCGNWSESASWQVPADSTSGIYFAKLVRESGAAGASHVVFVVRDDDGASDVLFQTSDTTWQAYNAYGGNSLYTGAPAGRAYEVSYNRPFTTRGGSSEDWVFNSEYPMVRWLERNGYDVSYFTGVDSDRFPAELLGHKAFLSVGHDEYWSGGQRANVEAARDAGVNLAFFSGNEIFWKTRWESDHRTLVSYKETHANAKIDPLTNVWTGTWRDPRSFNPEGGRAENALTGTAFTVNSGSAAIQVPAEDGKLRLWRGTPVAGQSPGGVATLTDDTVGYEWDEDLDNGSRPAGLIRLSSTTVNGVDKLQDYGSTFGPGTATHHLTLYRDGNGTGKDALVFGAGTVQWPWGLDGEHDRGSSVPNASMEQATVNLLADMGIQPGTLQGGLAAASASTDTTAPVSTITSPTSGANVDQGAPMTLHGTASDSGGRVAGVEVSVDDGASWHPAAGREAWSYTWTPDRAGDARLLTRAADDSGNLGGSSAISVTVGGRSCPCSLFGAMAPGNVAANDGRPIEVGVRFRADQDGLVTGLRYWKGAGWSGSRDGHLWTAGGTLLASVGFTGESGSGWQEATLSTPVAVTKDTTYVASYFSSSGSYSVDQNFFTAPFDAAPLHAPAGENGVYVYDGGFPASTSAASNYWADIVFTPADRTPPTLTAVAPADGGVGIDTATNVSATFSEALDASTVNAGTVRLRDAGGALVPAGVTYAAATRTATLTPAGPLSAAARYTATVSGVTDTAGNALAQPRSWSFTTAAAADHGSGGGANEHGSGNGQTGAGTPGTGTGTGAGAVGAGGTPGDPGPTAADRAAPRVRVSQRRTRVSLHGVAKLRAACPASEQSCRITLRLERARHAVAARTLNAAGGKTRTFKLKLSRSALRVLIRKGSLRVTAVVAARDLAANRATTRTPVRLLAPRRPGAA